MKQKSVAVVGAVEVIREGDILVIKVVERPAINKITLSGNKDIKSEELLKGLRGIGLAVVLARQRAFAALLVLDLFDRRHISHRTSGAEIGQYHPLKIFPYDIGRLGHEVHAAEDDVFGVGLRGEARELERVAGQVGVAIDVGALVVVAEQHGVLAEAGAGGFDAGLRLGVGEAVVAVEMNGGGGHGNAGVVGADPRGDVGEGLARIGIGDVDRAFDPGFHAGAR